MRGVWALVTAIALGAGSAAAVLGQQPPRQPAPVAPMTIEKVKENLYFIRGPFNNAAADTLLHEPGDVAIRVTPEGLIVVDDKFPQHTQEILEKIKSVSMQPIRYLLNTHHHADHAGGDANFINLTEIIGHRNVRENMIRNKQAGAPRIVYNDQISVFVGNAEARAMHLGRGHTNGDSVIYFPDLRTVHTGDLLIDGMPYIDYENGGSALEWPKTLQKLLDIDFIPGHGKLLGRADVLDNITALNKLNTRMADLVTRGVPKDQATAQVRAYLKEIGWDNTVSTATFLARSLNPLYDEIAASLQKR
ncbi:MAG: MBL fold metallo-hydrolase [Vicinamibacterales bacterium]